MGLLPRLSDHRDCSSTTSFALTVGLVDCRFVRLEIIHTYQR